MASGTRPEMIFAIVAITERGAQLARRIGESLMDSTVHLPERFRQTDQVRYFEQPLKEVLPELFASYGGLICIMATGIVVRLLAPHLRSKASDPAVVVMDEAGAFAVSLLSGHLGGANELAGRVARITGGRAVITTATDVNGLPAWDELARRYGLVIEPTANIKHLNSRLLRGEKIALVDRRGRIAPEVLSAPGVFKAKNFAAALNSGAAGMVFVTHRLIPDLDRRPNLLLLRPRDLVVGIGCNRGTTTEEIEAVLTEELHRAFLSPASVACLATIADKADEPGLNEFARRFDRPIEYHAAAALNRVVAPTPPSAHALMAVGAKGVCEPAAILSAGGGRLLVTKKKRGNVTVAVAEKNGD